MLKPPSCGVATSQSLTLSYNIAMEFATITFAAPRGTFECFVRVGDPTGYVTGGLDPAATRWWAAKEQRYSCRRSRK
jgi:hypothetical protein